MTTSIQLQKIEDLLMHTGCKCIRKGKQIQAQCPAHDDITPSLTVSENKNGVIGMHCHAGCKTEDVLDALGLCYSDLFPNNRNGSRTTNNTNIKAKYNYTDKEGKILYQSVRFPNKKFSQRQPKVGGGWKWNLKGIEQIIYNLPQVVNHIEEEKSIFLVEGEKDADNLISRNICASTSPMGAGKWKSDYNKYFKNAELVILPDNDEPGKKHALSVARELLEFTKSLRILILPDLKIKQDVSDWLVNGGSREKLLELSFNSSPISTIKEAEDILGVDIKHDSNDHRNTKDLFFEDNLKLYSKGEEERVIADFNIEIESIVNDDREGRIFYIIIREMVRGREIISDTIEIEPHCLDNLSSFYKAIRPYSMGAILQYRNFKTKPLRIFKWLLQKFDKPVVRRPDHVGFLKGKNKRPFWLFGNALVCPPWKNKKSNIVEPNEAGEFIIEDQQGYTLPLYESEAEKEQIAPIVNINVDNIGVFMGEVKTKLLQLIGGGDSSGKAKNYGKLLLAYVIYHLYEEDLYEVNDMNGHTVVFYVFGPKGTGKTTYFNTVLRAFFGLLSTENIKGNSVSIPGIENIMTSYSNLPVCYDEYNPEASNVSYQHINSYYHKTGRAVSDTDKKNRNKFINIRSTFSITSNYRINLDIDQADATQSRAIYFQYKKAYRSEDQQLFRWMQTNLNRLSSIMVHLLLNQTDEKRERVKKQASKLYNQFVKRFDVKNKQNPNKYEIENRLTDNYTRLIACYELVFGQDDDLRQFITQEILKRFAAAKANDAEHSLISDMAYLSSSGAIKEAWHYKYNNNKRELYIDLNQCYQTYEIGKREKALSKGKFKEVLKNYFETCGGYYSKSKRWKGSYYDNERNQVNVNKVQHSYILGYRQVIKQDNRLKDMFRPEDEHQEQLSRLSISGRE